jgi:hypothetical protein
MLKTIKWHCCNLGPWCSLTQLYQSKDRNMTGNFFFLTNSAHSIVTYMLISSHQWNFTKNRCWPDSHYIIMFWIINFFLFFFYLLAIHSLWTLLVLSVTVQHSIFLYNHYQFHELFLNAAVFFLVWIRIWTKGSTINFWKQLLTISFSIWCSRTLYQWLI